MYDLRIILNSASVVVVSLALIAAAIAWLRPAWRDKAAPIAVAGVLMSCAFQISRILICETSGASQLHFL
jgi:hypothetical protein